MSIISCDQIVSRHVTAEPISVEGWSPIPFVDVVATFSAYEGSATTPSVDWEDQFPNPITLSFQKDLNNIVSARIPPFIFQEPASGAAAHIVTSVLPAEFAPATTVPTLAMWAASSVMISLQFRRTAAVADTFVLEIYLMNASTGARTEFVPNENLYDTQYETSLLKWSTV